MRNRIGDERDFLTRFLSAASRGAKREKRGEEKRVLDEKRRDSRKSHRFLFYSFCTLNT
jgi:hypothetical protein